MVEFDSKNLTHINAVRFALVLFFPKLFQA